MKESRRFAFSSGYAITLAINKQGSLTIDTIGYRLDEPKSNPATLIASVVAAIDMPVKNVMTPCIVNDECMFISTSLTKIKSAVTKLEDAFLSPHTAIGKRRLMKEFELIINDDD